jgi:hypothetical protein
MAIMERGLVADFLPGRKTNFILAGFNKVFRAFQVVNERFEPLK